MRHIESRPPGHSARTASSALALALAVLTLIGGGAVCGDLRAAPQAPGPATLPGVVNYTPIDADVAVGGVLAFEALPELKRRGFKTVLNLRQPSEPDANVEAEGEAVRGAGLRYINLPFRATDPYDVAAAQVEPFLKVLADRSNLPVLIHSAQSHRAVGLLLIKRVLEDGWSMDKGFAAADAQVLADGSAGAARVRGFVIAYLKAHPG